MANGIQVQRFAPARNRTVAFFLGFLRQPGVVASVMPSSRYLARRLADPQLLARARSVVELGPGTGVVTRAMLEVLPPDARLLAIEVNEDFAAMLRTEEDRRLIAHCGSAAQLREAVALHALPQPEVVVSGIPFSTMPPALGRHILQQVWSCLAPGGHFVAYQLRRHVAVLGRDLFGVPASRLEMRNVPPVRVFDWRKPA
jgi:phospholipid N-methyltransferase